MFCGLCFSQLKGLIAVRGVSQRNGFFKFCKLGQPNGLFKFRGLSQQNGFFRSVKGGLFVLWTLSYSAKGAYCIYCI